MTREQVEPAAMRLPVSATPRPGERVTWFARTVVREGTFLGHTVDGQAAIQTPGQAYTAPRTPEVLRRTDPFTPKPANWHDLPAGSMWRPTREEHIRLTALLDRMVPPGIRCRDFVTELWLRGYETFIVGGSVRDIICNCTPHDVDLVTTMPLYLAKEFVSSIIGKEPAGSDRHGFMRLGRNLGDGNNYIDLKLFAAQIQDPADAVFGGDFLTDIKARDFSANAIYYEPVNNAVIDPSQAGIEHAAQRSLDLVHDHAASLPANRGKVVVRCAKFMGRGFTVTQRSVQLLKDHYVPCLDAMDREQMRDYVDAQLLSKTGEAERAAVLIEFQKNIVVLGGEEIWARHFAPIVKEFFP